MSEYKKHYENFSRNVEHAARTWHHSLHLNNRVTDDEKILKALNRAPRFWLDQRYSALQMTIIFLGKIFDKGKRAHSVDKTIKVAAGERDHFNRESLRARKVEIGGEFQGIDEYIDNASDLTGEDIKIINAEIEKAKVIWDLIKPLRDKVYAHNAMISEQEREALFEVVKYADISSILQILLNVSNAVWQAENNGRKPDFSYVPKTRPERPVGVLANDITRVKTLSRTGSALLGLSL